MLAHPSLTPRVKRSRLACQFSTIVAGRCCGVPDHRAHEKALDVYVVAAIDMFY